MKKETENGAEIKVEVIPKVESFWKRNKDKFVKAGCYIVGVATGFFIGTVFTCKEIACEHVKAETELKDAPFEEGPAK